MTDIAVVGAGVVGLAFALAAARQGFAVELFDKTPPGEAARSVIQCTCD